METVRTRTSPRKAFVVLRHSEAILAHFAPPKHIAPEAVIWALHHDAQAYVQRIALVAQQALSTAALEAVLERCARVWHALASTCGEEPEIADVAD